MSVPHLAELKRFQPSSHSSVHNTVESEPPASKLVTQHPWTLCAMAQLALPPDSARAAVQKRLDSLIRVSLCDGRVLVGKLSCFDKQRNLLLAETKEQRFLSGDLSQAPEYERNLGLVLVPRKHVTACFAIRDS